ncbi:hypothetical protein [Christiangramia sabulilitoris]|uniref:Uncharacterized protein n=1 Tax=Christiangramia sabulilitoris TaxID=2583991 RepID=A0A550I0K2_9FLAO|nr:hypothetical protein [Christiangramia sabulilitoris]TRO64509.1 hypothetical protein FGM01_13550 [Christiangramia sabulilitoris]
MYAVSKFKKSLLVLSIFIVPLISCKNDKENNPNQKEDSIQANNTENIIEVVTNEMDFQIPSRLKSGWTTFRYINKSSETHFFIFEKMPEGITIDNYNNELVPPFKAAFNHLINDEVEEAMKEFEKVPAWWNDVKLGGGVGLISPKSVAESTIYMHPGTYVMECYVRMPNGMPHAFYGMIKEIQVTEETNDIQEPSYDHQISISSEEGITFQDSIKAGNYQLAINFKDQKQYETLLGHDVNLVRLTSISKLDTLGKWINAANIKAFRTPIPEGLTFLGGVEDLEEGETGYFKTQLKQGTYVLISEIPNVIDRKMYKTFKVY